MLLFHLYLDGPPHSTTHSNIHHLLGNTLPKFPACTWNSFEVTEVKSFVAGNI